MRAIKVITLLSIVGIAMSAKSTIQQKLAQTGIRQDAPAAASADNLVAAVAAPVAAAAPLNAPVAAVAMPILDPSALSDLSIDDSDLNA